MVAHSADRGEPMDRPRILIVEDSPTMRQLLAFALRTMRISLSPSITGMLMSTSSRS